MRLQLFVAEGSGFRAAIVRGVGLAVSTFALSLLPFKFASSIREAAVAIGPQLSEMAGGPDALVAAVSQVRPAGRTHGLVGPLGLAEAASRRSPAASRR